VTFEIEIDGAAKVVTVETLAPRRYRIVIDGVASEVSAERVGEYGLSILANGEGQAADASREVQVVPSGVRGELLVTLAGRTVPVVVNGRTRRRSGAQDGGRAGAQSVSAPMPGRVVRVLVAPGDTVTARQGVVVVEAMKMENELRSPKAGTVKEVSVAAGTSVEAGRVLVVIE
jgi:biotin carboxyl carrier protein